MRDSNKVDEFLSNWKDEFIERIRVATKSKKQDFNYTDSLKYSQPIRTDFDKLMIEYLRFVSNDPLSKNDLYKYVNSYINGKKLNDKYFRHDLEILKYYYDKADKNKVYNPFHKKQYEKYVLFMMLKFSEHYKSEFDTLFNIIYKEGREYNPLSSCPAHIRAELPIIVKEYDISRAYPTFIFIELKMTAFDVYELIDKKTFNRLLNTHSGTKGATIEQVRDELRPIFGDRVNEVITEERFYNQGRMFRDLVKYEESYIRQFVEANELKTYVRLHDGIVVLPNVKCEVLQFGEVIFKEKQFVRPQIINDIINFYDDFNNTSAPQYKRFLNKRNL